MNYKIKEGGMVCASAEAESKVYDIYNGKSRIWLVARQDNAADNIYVSSSGKSDGFAGRTLEFDLGDGNSIKLQGPWQSNSGALLADTGIDVTDKHLTCGCIGKGYKDGEILDVVYIDYYRVLGHLGRIEKMAQELANEHKCKMFYFSQNCGGSSRYFKEPADEKELPCEQF